MKAKLVYDGGNEVFIPEEMGVPRDDQMQGTPAEQLVELCARACYDSLGKGRPSFTSQEIVADYPKGGGAPSQETVVTEGHHDHIRKVNHGSVWEHVPMTIKIGGGNDFLFQREIGFLCCNRPGVIALPGEQNSVRITFNLRSAIEWREWTKRFYRIPGVHSVRSLDERDSMLANTLMHRAHAVAPRIAEQWNGERFWYTSPPVANDHEKWISLYLVGSRGFSHELVRHGDFTAISQRSTRFVDESESPWVEHPLITEYCRDISNRHAGDPDKLGYIKEENPVIAEARQQYRGCAKELEQWLAERGVDKTSARKQARGAARGYLGNSLQTELIFSASVAQWKTILRQRATKFADAEIREIACQALGELKRSRYGDSFSCFQLQPSPDGIGQVAVEDL